MSATTASQDLDDVIRRALHGEHLQVSGLDWLSYQKIMEATNGLRVRFTYDQGSLEFMPTSALHALYSRLLCHLITILAEELKRPLRLGGDLTFERADLDRGLSPDECFWFANAHKVRGKRKIDFTKDPPPDVAVEIEITRTVLSRLPVYAALRVPEVWRTDGKTLQVGLLQSSGRYKWGASSPNFPGIPVSELARFLQLGLTQDHGELLREFREWVRKTLKQVTSH